MANDLSIVLTEQPDLVLTLGDTFVGSAYSPQVEVEDIEGGHRVTVTYKDAEQGITTKTFDVLDGTQGPKGDDGYSPTVAITDTADGHVVTITDATGEHSYTVPTYAAEESARQSAEDARSRAEGARVRAEDQRAENERQRVAEWATLKEGVEAATDGAENVNATVTKSGTTATISVTDREGTTRTATVSDGETGPKGEDGVSPTASVQRVEGGAEVTVTDASGTTTAMIYDAELTDGGVTTAKLADGAVTAAKLDSDLQESIEESKVAVGHVSINRQLEFGSISIKATGWTYSNSDNRVRLARGTTLHLVPGDTVGFADITKEPRFYYGYESNGSYYVPDARWLAVGEVLNVEHEGNYVFNTRATADGGLSGDELMEAVSSFYIDHTTNLVGDVKTAVTSLDDAVASLDSDVKNITIAEASNTYASISHQGYSYTAPKNTAAAYVKSQRKGYLYAENDVNRSSDGQLVMWHDTSLSVAGYLYDVNGYLMYTDGVSYYGYDEPNQTVYRLNQDGTYTAVTVDVQDLSRLNGSDVVIASTPGVVLMHFDVGRYRGDDYIGEHILTFREWILLCKKLGMHAYIDHKPNILSNIPEMMGDLTDLGMVENVTWICGRTTTLADAIRQYDGDARIAILAEPTDEAIAAYDQLAKGRGISFDLSNALCTTANAQKVLRAGYGLECYYTGINGTSESVVYARINELLDMGVQRITLDRYLIRDAMGMLATS